MLLFFSALLILLNVSSLAIESLSIKNSKIQMQVRKVKNSFAVNILGQTALQLNYCPDKKISLISETGETERRATARGLYINLLNTQN